MTHGLGFRNVYQSNWHHWVEWCSGRGVDPLGPCPPNLADFLVHKFDAVLTADTIAVYQLTIGGIFRAALVGRFYLSADLTIFRFLHAFARTRPKSISVAPCWNLPFMLDLLCAVLYEPIKSAVLQFLSLKTCFLELLAPDRHRSEIQALSVLPDLHKFGENYLNVIFFHDLIFFPVEELGSNCCPRAGCHPCSVLFG